MNDEELEQKSIEYELKVCGVNASLYEIEVRRVTQLGDNARKFISLVAWEKIK